MFIQIFILFIFVLLNGIVTGAELEILSANSSKLQKVEGKKKEEKAALILKLRNEPSFIPSIAISYTLLATFISVFSSVAFSGGLIYFLLRFEYFYSTVGLAILETVVVLIITITVSAVSIIFSETVPKRIAISYPEEISLMTINGINVVCKILTPFSFVLGKASSFITRVMRIKDNYGKEEKKSEDDIRYMIEESVVNEEEKEMIENIFDLNDTIVEAIATHRTEVMALDMEYQEVDLLEVLRSEHSRIPVYEENIDNIIGILHVKDVMNELLNGTALNEIDISKIVREPYKVPHSKKIDELLGEMQANKTPIAIVIDEYGGTFGVVTVEDIIEEVIGPVFDEYDVDESKDIEHISEGHLIIKGITPIEDVEEELGFEFEEEDKKDCDTIGGFIIARLGRIPSNEEDVLYVYKNASFKVRGVYENRIQELLITLELKTEV